MRASRWLAVMPLLAVVPDSAIAQRLPAAAPPFELVEREFQAAIVNRIVGAAVGLIAHHDTILFQKAVGEIEPGVPMPIDAIARLASITKPITATAILLLEQEGKLQLSDPVHTWFSGFGAKVQVADKIVPVNRPVTVRDLLTHQAGLATGGPAFEGLFDASTAEEYSRRIGAIPLRFQPGTQFEYGCCGSAYEVLGAIVEKVTGQSYRDFLDQRVLRPLGMHDTCFNVPPEKRQRLASQYRKDASGALVPFRRRGQEETENAFFSGAGGLRSTVGDYYRFARFLLNGGELDGVRLLNTEFVLAMTTNQVGSNYPTAGYGWGYGVRVRTGGEGNGPETIGSFGWNGGTGTLFLVDSVRGLIFVIMAPSNPGTPGVSGLRTSFVAMGYAGLPNNR